MVCMNFGKNSNWSYDISLSAKLPYLQNGTSYSLGKVLILTGTCDFYLVFHISYRFKLNGLHEFWEKLKLVKQHQFIFEIAISPEWHIIHYSLGEVLILTGTCDFYLVFHISYRLKLNGLHEFANGEKLKLVTGHQFISEIAISPEWHTIQPW